MDEAGWARTGLGWPDKGYCRAYSGASDASLMGLELRRTRSSPRQCQDHVAVTLARSPQHLEFRKKVRRKPNLDAAVRRRLRLSGDASKRQRLGDDLEGFG